MCIILSFVQLALTLAQRLVSCLLLVTMCFFLVAVIVATGAAAGLTLGTIRTEYSVADTIEANKEWVDMSVQVQRGLFDYNSNQEDKEEYKERIRRMANDFKITELEKIQHMKENKEELLSTPTISAVIHKLNSTNDDVVDFDSTPSKLLDVLKLLVTGTSTYHNEKIESTMSTGII